MASRLLAKVAIITGARSQGRGIGNGKAAAMLFAREGDSVVGLLRSTVQWLCLLAASVILACVMNSLLGGAVALRESLPGSGPDVVIDPPHAEAESFAEACAARFGSFNWWFITGDPQSPCVRELRRMAQP
jgi:NAD(P)-dependent dehydrogenase (short-subunit alcohol dehydrogenase family)